MKQIKIIHLLAIILTFADSCVKEPFEPQIKNDIARTTLRAVLPREKQTTSKVQFLDNPGIQMEARWKADDRIGVFGRSSANVSYQIQTADIHYGGKTADFHTDGNIPDGPLTAYYPYQENAGWDGQTLSVEFPATQMFTRSKNVSAPDPDAFILAATGDRSNGLRFLNITSLLKIGYIPGKDEVVKQVIFTDLDGKPMNGRMNITWTDGVPSATLEPGGSPSITLDCGEGVLITGETLALFWIPVPAGHYENGFRISFILKDGSRVDKTIGTAYGKTLYRNTVHPIGDVPTIQSSNADISYELKENVVILDADKMELIRDASLDSDVVPSASGNGSWVIMDVLAAYAHKDLALKMDDYVIINQVSELFPNGFIGQVTEYTPTGDEARIRIRQCQDFAEPFTKLQLGRPIYNADGTLSENGGIELDLASSLERIETPDGEDLPFDVEGDTLTLYEPVKAVTSSSYTSPRLRLKTVKSSTAAGEDGPGEMSVGVQLKLSTKFSMGADENGNTEYIHFNVNPKVLLTFNVKFSATKEFDGLSGERDFGTFYFAPIAVGPLVIRPQVEIGAYCGASASAELNVSYKYIANWGNYGFSYQRGQGFAIRSQVSQPEEEDGINIPEASLAGSVGFSVGLFATPGVSLYGLITANLKSKFGLNFSMGYEGKLDADGFSRGLYFQIAPEFSLTPMVTTLGGVWTKTWEEWQPLEFDPIWQKYIWPEAIASVTAIPTKEEIRHFYIYLGGEKTILYLSPISGYRKVHYRMVLKKETLFNVGVGFAIYKGRKFNHWQMTDFDKRYYDAGLEDYISFTFGAIEEPFYEKSVAVDYYSGPDDGEDSKTIEGDFDYEFENGYYYTIVPTAFFPNFSTAPLMHYDYGELTPYGVNRHSFVCHWPYLSNGELFPESIVEENTD